MKEKMNEWLSVKLRNRYDGKKKNIIGCGERWIDRKKAREAIQIYLLVFI